MKVTITFDHETEEDGFDGSTTIIRHEVDDLYALARAFAEAARAGGFTYVEDVAFEKDDGQMLFGGF
tara:strand:+ start:1137 stop:1337 length:201 start_codon:yes stop_codon:yes gene_type:complete